MKKFTVLMCLLLATSAHGSSLTDDLLNYIYAFPYDGKECVVDFASQLPFQPFAGYGTAMIGCSEVEGFTGSSSYGVTTYALDEELVKISGKTLVMGGVSGALYEVIAADFKVDRDLYYIGDKTYVRTASGAFYELVPKGIVADRKAE